MEWYGTLQKTLMIYLVPITPLNCVMIKMGYEALCIPGTGLTHYPVTACVLLELLPCLLPKTNDKFSLIINMVRMELNNGYYILWCILELRFRGLTPHSPSRSRLGPTMASLISPMLFNCTILSLPKRVTSMTTECAVPRSSRQSTTTPLPTSSPLASPASTTISPGMMMATCLGPSVSWVLRTNSTKLSSSAPSWSSYGLPVWLARQMPGSLTSPSKVPRVFFG